MRRTHDTVMESKRYHPKQRRYLKNEHSGNTRSRVMSMRFSLMSSICPFFGVPSRTDINSEWLKYAPHSIYFFMPFRFHHQFIHFIFQIWSTEWAVHLLCMEHGNMANPISVVLHLAPRRYFIINHHVHISSYILYFVTNWHTRTRFVTSSRLDRDRKCDQRESTFFAT